MGDEVCPDNGLSNNEKELVRQSWALIKADWNVHGIEVFMRLFETYPNIQKYFKSFDNMSSEEIRASTKLRAHIINFKGGLSSFVKNLDDIEVLKILIQKLADNHFRRGIQVESFQKVFDLFVAYGKEVANFDENTCVAWSKTFKVVASVIEDHAKPKDSDKPGDE